MVTVLHSGSHALGIEFTVAELMPLSGGNDCSCKDINNQGIVVGTSKRGDNTTHACLWNGSQVVDLGTLGGANSEAVGINDSGQVVGWSQWSTDTSAPWQAFIWTQQTGMQELSFLATSSSRDQVRAIGNQGQIVGYYIDANNYFSYCPYLWDSQHGMQQLPALKTNTEGNFARDINSSGVTVGTCVAETGNYSHAVMWPSATTIVDLGRGNAMSINDLTHVLVRLGTRNYVIRNADTVLTDMTIPSDVSISSFASINNDDQVVGSWGRGSNAYTAVLFDPSSGWQELQALGGPSGASGINNSGQIVGYSQNASKTWSHGFILTPVPEPSTLALAGVAVVSLLACAWRRWA